MINQTSPNRLELMDVDFNNISCFQEMSKSERVQVLQLSLIRTEEDSCENSIKYEHVDIYHLNMIKVVRMFPNLVSLSIVNHKDFTDAHFAELGFSVLENLEALILLQNTSLTGETFKRIANNCTLLIRLTFVSSRYECVFDDDDSFIEDQYTGIDNTDLVEVLKSNASLYNLSLTVPFVSNETFSLVTFIVPALQILEISMSHKDINDYCFMHRMIQILAIPTILCFKVKYNSKTVIDYHQKKLIIANISNNNNHSNSGDYSERLADLFRTRKQDFKSITFTNLQCVNNDLLRVIGQANSDILDMFMLVNCGETVTVGGFHFLLSSAFELRLVFVLNGSRLLGRSGSLVMHDKVLVAILRRDDRLDKKELEDLVQNRVISSRVMFELSQYYLEEEDSDDNDSSCESV
jgi:hypothetical protein